jgi:hypothetical protein
MCIGTEEALVVDVTDFPHDSEEIRRQDPHSGSIPYEWKIKDR